MSLLYFVENFYIYALQMKHIYVFWPTPVIGSSLHHPLCLLSWQRNCTRRELSMVLFQPQSLIGSVSQRTEFLNPSVHLSHDILHNLASLEDSV